MKPVQIIPVFIALASLVNLPLSSRASNEKPFRHLPAIYPVVLINFSDSIPSTKKSGTATDDNSANDVIKTVPKARKQAIPIPVGVQVKPIILIKPKIIKPIIKILH